MPDPILEILKYATPSAVVLLFLWKIMVPWSDYWLNAKGAGKLEKRVNNIENNDLHSFHEFKQEMRERVGKLETDVAFIKGRLNGHT